MEIIIFTPGFVVLHFIISIFLLDYKILFFKSLQNDVKNVNLILNVLGFRKEHKTFNQI